MKRLTSDMVDDPKVAYAMRQQERHYNEILADDAGKVNPSHKKSPMLIKALAYAHFGLHTFACNVPLFDDEGNCVGCTCEEYKRKDPKFGPDYKCKNPGKCPACKWKEEASIDPRYLIDMFQNQRRIEKHPATGKPFYYYPNIAIATGPSNLLVIDEDTYKEVYGDLGDLLSPDEQETVKQLSGSHKGSHLFYKRPEGKNYTNRKGKMPPGIDIRGCGGYIMAYPSLHMSGKRYEWINKPSEMPLSELPPAICEILDQADQKTAESVKFTQTDATAKPKKPKLKKWKLSTETSKLITNPPKDGDRSANDMTVCVALCYSGATDDDIREVFHTYPIGTDGKYAERGDDYLKLTIGNARAWVAENPPDEDEQGVTTQSESIISDLSDLRYTFRWNLLDDSLEVNGKPMDDGLAALIRTQMRDQGYGGKGDPSLAAVEDAYRAHAYQNSYHPFKDYFNGLVWDGVSRFDLMSNYIEDDHPLIVYPDGSTRTVFSAFLRRWAIGAVAKIFESGKVRGQNPMLVFDGAQDMGKSTFTRWLSGRLEPYFIEEPIRPDDKEHNRYLAAKFMWEAAELGATTRRADREALKAFITKAEVTFRKPFDRHAVVKPALASFVGTINNETGFLTDPTGNRRFLVVHLTGIDHSYQSQIDADQLWAEAYHLYKNGETWLLNDAERATRDANNEGYKVEDPYTGWILKYYEVDTDTEDETWRQTSAEIAQYLGTMGVKDNTMSVMKGIAITLKGLGLRQHSNDRPRKWMGIKKRNIVQ